MNERLIQALLFKFLNPHIAVSNINLFSRFESDFVSITKAGYIHEFEIKISKSDFKADAKKKCGFYTGGTTQKTLFDGRVISQKEWSVASKYEQYLMGTGPNYFNYVFPDGLIDLQEVPEWCGVYVVIEKSGHTFMRQVRYPKRIRKEKATETEMQKIARSLMFKHFSPLTALLHNRIGAALIALIVGVI